MRPGQSASIVQGCLLTRAPMKRYQHNNMESLKDSWLALMKIKKIHHYRWSIQHVW